MFFLIGIPGEGKLLVTGSGFERISCQARGRVFCLKLMEFKVWDLDAGDII